MKVISYNLKIRGIDVAITDNDKLKRAIKLLNKELDTVQDSNAYAKIQKDLGALKGIQQQVRDETRKNKRQFLESAEQGSESYRELQFRLVRLKKEFKELGREAREGLPGKRLQTQISGLSKELKTIDGKLGDNFRNVGNYRSAVSGAFGALKAGLAAAGIVASIEAISQALLSSIRLFADFTNQVAILQAVSGASADEIENLRDRALELGETTQFTASQVAQLQTNFARVGFDPTEIDAATESTLDLALATGEDLAQASEVVAATLGGYRLSAQETARVNNVMAESFNSTALQLDTFREATKNVGPVAASLNVDIETTTATIGALANVGIRGSRAGTALRRIFSELGNESSKLSQKIGFSVNSTEDFNKALAILREEQIGVTEATELVGLEAATAFTVLANSVDEVNDLSAAFNNASDGIGSAAEAAAIVEDTLTGDIKQFQSALEGFQLFFVDLFDNTLRGAVSGARGIFKPLQTAVTFLFNVFEPLVEEVGALIAELFDGERAADGFQGVIRLLGNTLNFVITVVVQLIRGLRQTIGAIKDFAQSSGFLSGIIDGLRTAFDFLREVIIEIPNALNGIISAYGALRDAIFGEGTFEGFAAEFEKGFNQARNYAGALDDLSSTAQEAAKNLKLTQDQTKELNSLMEELGSTTNLSKEQLNKIAEDALTTAGTFEEAYDKIRKNALAAFATSEAEEAAGGSTGGGGTGGGFKSLLPPEGSIERLKKQLGDLRGELEKQTSDKGIEKVLSTIIEKEEELKTLEDRINSIRAALSDDQIDDSILDLSGVDDGVTLEKITDTDEDFIKEQEEAIDKRAQLAIQGLQNEVDTLEAYEQRKTEILRQAELERLRLQLAFTEEGTAEYIRLKNEMYEKETERGLQAKQELQEVEEGFYQELRSIGFEFLQQALDAQFTSQLNKAKEQSDERLRILDEEREKRLEGVEKGSLEEARIEREFEERKQEIQKEAAREAQKIKIQQAIANTALAIGNALATVQPFIPNAVAAAALAAIRGAAQVAVLQSQSFGGGGMVQGPSHSGGGVKFNVRSTGQRVELEGNEGVINKRSMLSKKRMSVTGTPAEIASAINSAQGFGIRFPGVRPVPVRYSFQDGGVIPSIPTEFTSATNKGEIRVTTSLSEDSVDDIRQAVTDGSQIGSREGSREGVKEAGKRQRFEQSLANRIRN